MLYLCHRNRSRDGFRRSLTYWKIHIRQGSVRQHSPQEIPPLTPFAAERWFARCDRIGNKGGIGQSPATAGTPRRPCFPFYPSCTAHHSAGDVRSRRNLRLARAGGCSDLHLRGRRCLHSDASLPAKFLQKSTRHTRSSVPIIFTHFYKFASFISKSAFFISKNVIFIYLIFNELN